MGINYVGLAATAERLVRENGKDALLISETNTGTDYQPTITQTSETIRVVQSLFNKNDNNDFILEANDMKFLVSSAFTLNTKQRIETNGLQYSIVALKEIKPANTSVLYIVQGRL